MITVGLARSAARWWKNSKIASLPAAEDDDEDVKRSISSRVKTSAQAEP